MEPGTLDFSRSVPVTDGYDVAVCGGGPSGIAAAVSASCMGLKVLLMDSNAQLGGTCTSGLVSHWLGGRDMSCTTWVVGGLFKAFSDEAARRGCALIPGPVTDKKYQPHGWIKSLLHGIPIEPYGMARFLDEKVCQAGVDLLLNTQFVDVLLDRNHITHSIIFNKSGLSAVPVRAVVDATGDGDVAARSGCDCITGREEDGVQASVTLEFHVDQVAQDALAGYIEDNNCPRFKEQIALWSQQGTWKAASTFLITVQLTEKGVMMVNTPRIDGVDATDGRSITRGLLQCRKEIQDLFESLRKNVPGFEQARIKAVAPMLGVRESRRIRGNYQFTVAELESGRECQDVVGFSSYGWDLPHSINPSRRPTYGKSKKKLTPIPYRIMLPRPVRNLICPGRMVSVERVLLGPLRVMASCFAMGQAAGTAAAQVVADKTSFDRIDIQQLRQDLRGQGAIVDSDAI
ncbi:MAG: FAD-dependent oxidoreductase [Sedimentisphaerales bacterium]|nr:FAD-dependent oxidoreductase [Sedimentisphaerales bacterium]